MPRIIGIDIPESKRIEISLRYIYGIGPVNAREVLKLAKIDPNKRAKELTEMEIAEIRAAIENLNIVVEGELKRNITQNIKRLKDIKCYKGIRHQRNLPVRGQKTQKNARTKRGKKSTVGGVNPKVATKK